MYNLSFNKNLIKTKSPILSIFIFVSNLAKSRRVVSILICLIDPDFNTPRKRYNKNNCERKYSNFIRGKGLVKMSPICS